MIVRVAGLDLSLTSTGVTLTLGGKPGWTHTVKSAGKKTDDLAARQERLKSLEGRIVGLLKDECLDLAVIENPSYGSKFGSPHDRSGLWWGVVHGLTEYEIPVATVSPQGRAKYGTGKGNAKKPDVFAAAKATYIPLGFDIPNNDVADSVILAAMGSRHLGKPVEGWRGGALSLKKLEAMGGAAWPA